MLIVTVIVVIIIVVVGLIIIPKFSSSPFPPGGIGRFRILVLAFVFGVTWWLDAKERSQLLGQIGA